jgi:hypothetical protein
MGNYATIAEVRAYKISGVAALTATYSDGEVEAAIGLSESIIENICEDIFYVITAVYKFDGTGQIKLFFPPLVKYSLLSITYVKDIDIDGTTVINTFDLGTDYINYPHHIETALAWPGDSPRRGVFRGGVWPRGQKNIHVSGTWGRTTVPAEIKEATILLTLEKLQPGSSKMTSYGIDSAKWDDFEIQYKGSVKNSELSGFAEIDRILKRFINYSDLFIDASGDC